MTVTEAQPGSASPSQAGPAGPAPHRPGSQMQVRKRNGDTEPVDVNKIVRAVDRCAGGLGDVDPLRVATKTISGLYDGATRSRSTRGWRPACSPGISARRSTGRALPRSIRRSGWATPRA